MTCKSLYQVMREEETMTATLAGMTVPSWASHVEDKLAPMPLLLVQAYVDTLDRDLGTDILAHADQARAWLADAGLRVPDPDRPDPGFAGDLRLGAAGHRNGRGAAAPGRPGPAGAGAEPGLAAAGGRRGRPGPARAGPSGPHA